MCGLIVWYQVGRHLLIVFLHYYDKLWVLPMENDQQAGYFLCVRDQRGLKGELGVNDFHSTTTDFLLDFCQFFVLFCNMMC